MVIEANALPVAVNGTPSRISRIGQSCWRSKKLTTNRTSHNTRLDLRHTTKLTSLNWMHIKSSIERHTRNSFAIILRRIIKNMLLEYALTTKLAADRFVTKSELTIIFARHDSETHLSAILLLNNGQK